MSWYDIICESKVLNGFAEYYQSLAVDALPGLHLEVIHDDSNQGVVKAHQPWIPYILTHKRLDPSKTLSARWLVSDPKGSNPRNLQWSTGLGVRQVRPCRVQKLWQLRVI